MRVKSSTLDISNFTSVNDTTEGRIAIFDSEFSKLKLTNNNYSLKLISKDSQLMNSKKSEIYFRNVDIVLPNLKFKEIKILKISGKEEEDIRNFSFHCGFHFSPQINHFESTTEFLCSRCLRNRYSMSAGGCIIEVLKNTNEYMNEKYQLKNATCKTCPTGSKCPDNNLIARDNFYGFYENKTKDYKFFLCPEGYCCSSTTKHCKSPITCNYNRKGRLCGKCKEGYFISFVNNKCIENSKCSDGSRQSFWAVFIITFIIVALLLVFFKDLITIMKYVVQMILPCLK